MSQHAQQRQQQLPQAEDARVIQQPLQESADEHARDAGQCPRRLHHLNDANIVRLLLESGADVHARDDDQRTALHHANNAEVVRLLLESGADVNARDYRQHTALRRWWVYSWSLCSEKVRYLSGTPPRHVHRSDNCACNSMMLIDLLLEYGTDVNALDGEGRSVLDLCVNRLFWVGEKNKDWKLMLKKVVAAGASVFGRYFEQNRDVIEEYFGIGAVEQLHSRARKRRWHQYLTPVLQRRLYLTLERICVRCIGELLQYEKEEEKEQVQRTQENAARATKRSREPEDDAGEEEDAPQPIGAI